MRSRVDQEWAEERAPLREKWGKGKDTRQRRGELMRGEEGVPELIKIEMGKELGKYRDEIAREGGGRREEWEVGDRGQPHW